MSQISSHIESLLFVSPKPLTIKKLAETLLVKDKEIKEALSLLQETYAQEKRGFTLVMDKTSVQFVSCPENSKIVREFLEQEVSGELSKPSLETLTIIAYRGPISKIELEHIRGVNCSMILRNLLIRGLISESIDSDTKQEYNVTLEFLKYLGVGTVTQLPDYEALHNDETIKQVLEQTLEQEELHDKNKEAEKNTEEDTE